MCRFSWFVDGSTSAAMGPGRCIPALSGPGEAVAAWSVCHGVYPWELGTLTESDLLDRNGSMHHYKRMLTTQERLKWPNRTMPFFIDRMHFNYEQNNLIRQVLRELDDIKCITTKKATGYDKAYVRISGRREGCYADHWGMKGGEQIVNLQPSACLQRGTIFHLLFHALGFWHIHNNPVRDDYITINWANVQHGKEDFFRKYREDAPLTDFGFRYDYDSVMHASRKAYSANGRDTVVTKDPFATIGQRLKPSYFDIQKLRKLYDCEFEE